ncbi:Transmembrane protein 45B [Desmophyllum pertusum]|uniref:Transmembrane protein 45B n=1 Tax=Desmophyllum pertusum TaxID=174260 RepID=A0A9W9ZTK2_9CNID|nr:Transmembrane protein 45B [Desmophyllum pertusum]
MGSYAGHVLPGSFFVVFGLWWWFHALALIAKAQARLLRQRFSARRTAQNAADFELEFESTTWCKVPVAYIKRFPVEPCLKVIAASVGIIAELTKGEWSLINKSGHFSHLNNFSHATMFGIFLLGAVVEILRFYSILFLPAAIDHVFLIIGVFSRWGAILFSRRRTLHPGPKASYFSLHCGIFHRLCYSS